MAESLIAPLPGYDGPPVDVLRLDRCNALAPGNKWFKLAFNIARAKACGAEQLVSFGGAYSNHLHALAAWGYHHKWPTAAFIRADIAQQTPCIADIERWGMRLFRLSRSDYRRRHDPDFVAECLAALHRPYLIPEGGANKEGARGCRGIVDLIPNRARAYSLIMLACGTGTTLAGLAAAVTETTRVLGVPVLKAEAYMERDISRRIAELGVERGNWALDHRFGGRGFGRLDSELIAFIQDFERRTALPLDPVYTAKLCQAFDTLYRRGELSGESRILLLHSGGLQGRRGYPEVFTDSVFQANSVEQ